MLLLLRSELKLQRKVAVVGLETRIGDVLLLLPG